MSFRIESINGIVKDHLGNILLKELDLKPGIMVTVSRVDTSPDLRYARVFVSVFPEKEIGYARKALDNGLYRIQGLLNRKLSMKPIPRISFEIDLTEARAQEVEDLLKEI